MTRSDYFRPVSGGISGLCVEPDDNPLSARSSGAFIGLRASVVGVTLLTDEV